MNKLSRIFANLSLSTLIAISCAPTVSAEVRKLLFPTAYPMGRLSSLIRHGGDVEVISDVAAVGDVTVIVHPPEFLQLNVNPKCIEEPQHLKGIPIEGIDSIRISYMSMDESMHVCDKALAALPLFKNSLMFDCYLTDVTDAGLLGFKSLSKVVLLECYTTEIHGSFLKDFKRLQNIERLNVSHNAIKESYLTNLKELKNLRRLKMQETGLSNTGLLEICKLTSLKELTISGNKSITYDGMRHLAKLSNLERLDLGNNPNVTDEVLSTLQTLKVLNFIDVSRTHVTAAGLAKLKNLKMKMILLPEGYKVADLLMLKKTFPNTLLLRGGVVSEEMKIQFAPMK